jgi:holo-[acyl-carrier protein] synthase
MILGIGIDITEVARVQSSIERLGDAFLKRILLPDEIAYCQSSKNVAALVAVRFAAKEAISKAFGTGIGAKLSWLDMEVRRKESGEPFVVLHGDGQKLLEASGGRRLLISLSHSEHYATAVAILESAN